MRNAKFTINTNANAQCKIKTTKFTIQHFFCNNVNRYPAYHPGPLRKLFIFSNAFTPSNNTVIVLKGAQRCVPHRVFERCYYNQSYILSFMFLRVMWIWHNSSTHSYQILKIVLLHFLFQHLGNNCCNFPKLLKRKCKMTVLRLR